MEKHKNKMLNLMRLSLKPALTVLQYKTYLTDKNYFMYGGGISGRGFGDRGIYGGSTWWM
jgi:hypothetical protein